MWNVSEKYFNGFRLRYTYEEKTLIEKKEITKRGTLTSEEFELWSYLEWLPKKFTFQYYSHCLETDNLRCEPVGCCAKARNSCWCDVTEKLIFKETILKTFKLKSSMNSKYLLDVDISRRPGTTDQVDLTLSIRYDTSSNKSRSTWRATSSSTTSYTAPTSTTKLSFLDEVGHEIEYTSQTYLSQAKFEFKCHLLPNRFELKAYNTIYFTQPELLQCGSTSQCPDGVVCWCYFINQLRSTRSGRIRIPIFTTMYNGEVSKYSNYFLIINAQVDPVNHNQIDVKITVINNPQHEMKNISYVNF